MRILSIDPSLRNTGVIEALYLNDKLKILNAITHKTVSKSKESFLSAGEHDTLCAMHLATCITDMINANKPDLICAEIGSGAQSHSAAAALGAMKGFIGGLMSQHNKINWVIVTPAEAKRIIRPNVDKGVIQAWVLKNYKEYTWDKIKNKFEHQADAVIIALAGIKKFKERHKNEIEFK